MDGRPLAGARGPALEAGLRALGAAVGRLHALPRRDLPPPERGDVARAAEIVARARPDVADRARALAHALHEHRRESAGRTVSLHGDLTLDNALLAGGRVTLLDLDQVGAGPAAADLGRVLAWLRYRQVLGKLDAAEVARLGGALLAGYGEVRDVPRASSLRWHTAASVLTWRALGAVVWLKPRCLGLLDRHLDAARACLETEAEVAA
jgi:Ser/Thr protein kinase RdoA (MazF antagonist)